jgi:hypothetical protein
MRTKTMILSGVIAALSGASLMAQVYSLNAVGYINVTVPGGAGGAFSILADQLFATNQSTPQYISPLLDAQLLDGNHNGVEIFKLSGGSFVTLVVGQASGQPAAWSSPATAQATSLNPGEAVFIYNPYPTNFTLTFVGQVPQGNMTNSSLQGFTALNSGFSLISSIVPQTGAIDSVMQLGQGVANPGDEIFLLDPVLGYSTSVATLVNGIFSWQPASPSPAVAQGFYYYTSSPSGVTWVRNFSVQ